MYSEKLANHIRAIFVDDNWVSVNLKTVLTDVNWQQANMKVDTLNSIAAIVYHIRYYVKGILNVLEGGTLEIREKYSFDHPSINSKESWNQLLDNVFLAADKIATKIEEITDSHLDNDFDDGKYGSIYRNINGLIEHSYYHLGQIPIIKKNNTKFDLVHL